MNIPSEFQGSPAFQLVQSKGWKYEIADSSNLRLSDCPYCGVHSHAAFVIEIHGPADEQSRRDGLHQCHRCGKGGSLYSLKEHLGMIVPGVSSRKDWAGGTAEIEPLPDVDVLHQALLEDEAAMDYLMNGRGFSRDIIVQQKVGLTKRFFRECGEVRAIIYPYLVGGQCVFVHYRSLPTMPLADNKVVKAFNSPKGWDAPLYNGGVLQPGLKELVMVEGEANCIAAMDKGMANLAGVPGANFKKAEWIDTLDKLELEKIYICYDKDKPGQRAAQTLAARIGIERCWKIVLPEFSVTTDEGETRPGKDINEWFVSGGGTLEAFEQLKLNAQLFDVDGVSSTTDTLQELYDEISGKETMEPKYISPWPSLNLHVSFDEGDVIDVVAEEKVGKTTFVLNLIEHMVNKYGEDGVFVSLEMMKKKLARKWVCHVAKLADNATPKTPEEAKQLREDFMKAIPYAMDYAANRPGDLYFAHPQYKSPDDIYKLIRDCIRRYGVKWVALDHLQWLCDTTLGGKNRTQHLSEISKKLSQIAKEYGIQMIRIIQPHGIKPGQIATSRDADGASQIRKDCDCSMALHRNMASCVATTDQWESMPYVEQDTAMDDKMLVTNDLSRYTSGGQCTLLYDGARSTITEYNMAQIAKIKAEANKNVGYAAQLADLGIPTGKAEAAQEKDIPQPGEITI